MIGSTGVGKTTSTAKLAAAFAAKHGAANLGLITLDAYRVGAHEQLRSYGRILGVAVHGPRPPGAGGHAGPAVQQAHGADRHRRHRPARQPHPRAAGDPGSPLHLKLLVVNASAQGETIEDVTHLLPRLAMQGRGALKIDEAVKLAPALDAVIRHRLKVMAVANGQRVPEDWHRLSARR